MAGKQNGAPPPVIAAFLVIFMFFSLTGCEQPSGSNPDNRPPAGPADPPGMPQNVALSAGDSSIAVVWDLAADADSYQVWYTQTEGGELKNALAWQGSLTIGFTQGSAAITGLANGVTCYVWVRSQNAAGVSPYSGKVGAMPESSFTMPKLFFDYGRVLSSDELSGAAFPAGTYTAPAGRPLVLAPIEWRLDSDSYEWTVDGSVREGETAKAFSFTPPAQGVTYTIGVKAKKSGVYIEGAEAETHIQCTAPGAKRPIAEGTSNVKAVRVFDFVQAPGQFVGVYGGPVSASDTQNKVINGAQEMLENSNSGWIYSLGRFGGYVIYGFDHSVDNAEGPDIQINGNAFTGWNEPGTVWVSQDNNDNGLADDTWYELKGTPEGEAHALRRYAVTYSRPTASGGGGLWNDNRGSSGTFTGGFPWHVPGTLIFAGTLLETMSLNSGYVDTIETNKFDISAAVQADGSSIVLGYIDFVKVQCALLQETGVTGEASTETGAAFDLHMPNPDMLMQGADKGDGSYTYTVTNDSGYDLSVTLGGQTKAIKSMTGYTFILAQSEAYLDFSGGNVTLTKTTGQVTFINRV
jgi:hypothetical protein